jgi:hypothetical protein
MDNEVLLTAPPNSLDATVQVGERSLCIDGPNHAVSAKDIVRAKERAALPKSSLIGSAKCKSNSRAT